MIIVDMVAGVKSLRRYEARISIVVWCVGAGGCVGVWLVQQRGGRWENATKKRLFWECDSDRISHPRKRSDKAATYIAFNSQI
ncbi:hypothetical protein E2C01_025151 [Portunus trituberculatus]|uniref:Uncharacterized protein n=1 Tax=Portunus trituberculatus TaxID=210409 RepID=A0A5B7ECH8_PORTR|nr:hypothetical protein [Portunus trituberculatus]